MGANQAPAKDLDSGLSGEQAAPTAETAAPATKAVPADGAAQHLIDSHRRLDLGLDAPPSAAFGRSPPPSCMLAVK